MATEPKAKSTFQVPLRTILTVPYVVLTVVSISLVGSISYVNGQAALNKLAHQLQNETLDQINQHLISFLSIPQQLNQINQYAIQSGELSPDDQEEMQKHFLGQIQAYTTVSSLYFGNTDGGLVGSGREGIRDEYYILHTENIDAGDFHKIFVDQNGTPTLKEPVIIQDFDARLRPWYVLASSRGETVWSNIYILFTGQDIAIAASRPVYNANHDLLGVVSVDIFLSQISKYLETLNPGSPYQVFIAERSGALVATSTGEPLFTDTNQDGSRERVFASQSSSSEIRGANELLLETYGEYKNIPSGIHDLNFNLAGKQEFLQVSTIQDPAGIDWVVVVILPESVFMGQVAETRRSTLWLISVTAGITFVIGMFATSRIAKRISQLDDSALALADGKWETHSDTTTRISELNKLATSFNEMKEQLHSTMNRLNEEVKERERVENDLRKSEETFRALAENIPITVFRCRNDHRYTFLYLNESIVSLTGYAKEDFTENGLSFLDLYLPEDLPNIPVVTNENEHIINRRAYHISYRIRHRSGEVRWVDEWGIGILVDDAVEHLIGIMVDMTERQNIVSDLRKRTTELTALQATAVDISSPHSQQELLSLIVERAVDLLNSSGGGLYLTEPEARKIHCMVSYQTPRDFSGLSLDYGVGAAGIVAETGLPLIINDYATWPGRVTMFENEHSIHAVISVPMLWQGQVTGVIFVLRKQGENHFAQDDLEILNMFANHAAAAVESARLVNLLEQELKERRKVEAELQDQRDFATQIINLMGQGLSVTNEAGLFEFINPAFANMLGRQPEEMVGKFPSAFTLPADQEQLNAQKGIRQSGKSTSYESRLVRLDGSIASVLVTGVPRGNNEKYLGTIAVITDLSGQKYIEEQLRIAHSALAASKKELEQALTREKHLARTDELTGTHNRRHLLELAERKLAIATRYKLPLSVILFDIDHFKMINDQWGHLIGDQILFEVARVVQSELRNADLLGRYGGEEFIIVLPMTSSQNAYIVAERIREQVANIRLQTEKDDVRVTISSGITGLDPNQAGGSIEYLISRADEAMYAAKHAGRNRTVILE